MQLMLVALISIVVLVGFVAVVQYLGGGALLTSIGNLFTSVGQGVVVLATEAYDTIIMPAFQRIGWVVIGTLVVGVIGTFILAAGSTVPFWVGLVSLPMAGVFVTWIVINEIRGRNNPEDFSVMAVISAAFLGLLALGAWFFVAAHLAVGSSVNFPTNEVPSMTASVSIESLMDARMLAILGVVYILMAREVLFVVIDLVAHLAKLGVDFAEGTSNAVVSIAKTLITAGLKGLANVDINLADQELFKPAVKRAKARVNAAILPVLALGVLMPFPAVLCLTLVAGTFTYLAYENAENCGIDTLTWRQLAARSLVYVGYALLAVLALVVFFPPLQAQFDNLVLAVGALIGGILETAKDAIYWILGIGNKKFVGFPWYAALCGALFTGFVAWMCWPDEDAEGAKRRARQLLAAPFILLMFLAIGSLTLTIFTWGKADTFSLKEGASLSKMVAPQAYIVDGKVRLTHPEIPKAAKGYRYERRAVGETIWKALNPLANGVTHYDDATVVAGTTYAYRVAAVYASGETEMSQEVLVKVPDKIPDTSVASSSSSMTRPAVVRNCPNGNCVGNPGLDAYCARHPDVCNGR
jgi:hypothetical protein